MPQLLPFVAPPRPRHPRKPPAVTPERALLARMLDDIQILILYWPTAFGICASLLRSYADLVRQQLATDRDRRDPSH